jgi:DNA polymerase
MKPYLASDVYVPNEGDPSAKIWLVGEAPGYEEVMEHRPFCGKAGKMLDQVLAASGIERSECFITNLCHYRPIGNKFEALIDSDELKSGLLELFNLMQTHHPNVIVALGNAPLGYLTFKNGINAWRGSILESNGQKIIPTLHPAYILYDPTGYPILLNDFMRIREQSRSPELPQLHWHFVYGKDVTQAHVESYASSVYLSVDIESVKGTGDIICVGFGRDRNNAISITTDTIHGRQWIRRLLESDAIKIFHFGSFDSTMLEMNGYEINNYAEDTIIQAHLLNPELPRDLGFLASVYTYIPCYKTEGRSNIPSDTKVWVAKRNKEELLIYNCKDICATFWIWEEQKKEIEADQDLSRLYKYEMDLVHVVRKMGSCGLFRDEVRWGEIKTSLETKQVLLQSQVDLICDTHVNINSPKQVALVLYKKLELPVKMNDGKITSDADALVSLINTCKSKIEEYKTSAKRNEWRLKLGFVELTNRLRGINKLLSSYINTPISNDGRCKSLYKVNGTETGRLACNKFVDGTGVNGQTFPRGDVPT